MHEVQVLGGEVEVLSGEIAALKQQLADFASIVQAVEPWVGPEGQLRVRLERSEQAIQALISDPGNPHTSATRAMTILTAIPTPPA